MAKTHKTTRIENQFYKIAFADGQVFYIKQKTFQGCWFVYRTAECEGTNGLVTSGHTKYCAIEEIVKFATAQ